MKKTCNKKKLIFSLVIVIFIIINAFWIIHHKMLFGKYERITKDPSVPNAYISLKGNLTFSVSKTKYLNFGGNLGVSNPEKGMYLIIWPHMFRGFEYGFMIMTDNGTYNYYVDELGELQNAYQLISEDILLFESNKSELSFLISEYKEWKIAAEKGDKSYFFY